jgi:hypothetical protein
MVWRAWVVGLLVGCSGSTDVINPQSRMACATDADCVLASVGCCACCPQARVPMHRIERDRQCEAVDCAPCDKAHSCPDVELPPQPRRAVCVQSRCVGR